MKTKNIFILIITSAAFASCNTNYYMRTSIKPDGRAVREIYTKADSAFIAGDMSKNPFFFSWGEEWELAASDKVFADKVYGEEFNFNTRLLREASSVEGFRGSLEYEDYKKPLAEPAESLDKRFRWFYTYYTYNAVFQEVEQKYKGPVPIDEYLNEAERKAWFQEDLSPYKGYNGVELKGELDDLEIKYGKWYSFSIYQILMDIAEYSAGTSTGAPFPFPSQDSRKALYEKITKKDDFLADTGMPDGYALIDKYSGGSYFTDMYRANENAMEKMFEEKTVITNLFEPYIYYEVNLPGKVVSANTELRNSNSLTWKVDAWRVMANDLFLTAESRKTNYWAFAVTIVALLAIAVWCFAKYRKTSV